MHTHICHGRSQKKMLSIGRLQLVLPNYNYMHARFKLRYVLLYIWWIEIYTEILYRVQHISLWLTNHIDLELAKILLDFLCIYLIPHFIYY